MCMLETTFLYDTHNWAFQLNKLTFIEIYVQQYLEDVIIMTHCRDDVTKS